MWETRQPRARARARGLRRLARGSGVEPGKARAAPAAPSRPPLLSPPEDEAVLREAGFGSLSPFYAAFAFRGWVARA